MEYWRFWGVQVFGFVITQNPTAEADHAPPSVPNREHNAVPKPVVEFVFLRVVNQHAALYEPLLVVWRLAQGFEQVVPSGRCKADAVVFSDPPIQTTLFEVVHSVALGGA